MVRGVVLVEGRSDEAAVRALAERLGRDLEDEGVAVEVVGGAGGFARAALRHDPGVPMVALVDRAELASTRTALARAGVADLAMLVCDRDLEDELIRALGPAVVEAVVRAAGEERVFRTFQDQPAQRGRPLDAQLHRFLGTKSGRKIRYGRLLVEALDPSSVPAPLSAVLAAM